MFINHIDQASGIDAYLFHVDLANEAGDVQRVIWISVLWPGVVHRKRDVEDVLMAYLRAYVLALAIARGAGPCDGNYLAPSFFILAPILC